MKGTGRPVAYRLGFAVEAHGMRARRLRTRAAEAPAPLPRPIRQLADIFDYLERIGVQVYRLPNRLLPAAERGPDDVPCPGARAAAVSAHQRRLVAQRGQRRGARPVTH